MFFPIFTLMRIANAAQQRRFSNGPVSLHFGKTSPIFTAKRGGKWKKSGQPIDKITFALPEGWNQVSVDGKTCTLHSPADASGHGVTISVAVIDGPDDAQLAYDRLLQQQQAQEKFQLIDGGVVTRDRGLNAAHLKYLFESEGAAIVVREMVFTIGFRTLAYVQAQCAKETLPAHAAAIDSFFDSLKPSRRLEVPGTITAGLSRSRPTA